MIYSFSSFGYEGNTIEVEVDLRRGIPAFDIVGLADSAVAEARERMRSAIVNSGFEFPPERVLVSLSPADIKKEGSGFDLPMALEVLAQYRDVYKEAEGNKVFVTGELELSGNVRPVRGTYAALMTAKQNGILYAIIPNGSEVKEVPGMVVFSVSNIKEALAKLEEIQSMSEADIKTEDKGAAISVSFSDAARDRCGNVMDLDDLEDKNGMRGMKYAMAVAQAGRLNMIAIGSPGCGKTMALQRIDTITPDLTENESPSVTRIWSLAGLKTPDSGMMKHRPFRMPHQTASIEGICGGGPNCRPGEISLAHNGILFLDEAAEFRSSVLQMLRVPLENKSITLYRAGRSTVFPANFQLVMAVNPCPCGNYGAKDKVCLCSAKSIELYWQKFSAPLLDRIDIRYNFNNPDNLADKIGLSMHDIRGMIKRAWEIQYRRQGKLNRDLDLAELDGVVHLSDNASKKLYSEKDKNALSARSVTSILRIARTIADMKGLDNVDEKCMTDALELHGQLYHTPSI